MVKKYSSWWRVTIVVAAILAVAAVLKTEPTEAQFGLEQVNPGQSSMVTVNEPIVIDASSLPVISGQATGPVQVREEKYFIDKEQFEALKRQAAIPGFGPQLPVTAVEGQTPGAFVSFDGDVQGTAGCGNWIPADQALAVGDGGNPIIQAVNECLSVWNAAGTRLLGPVSLQSFFGQAAAVSVCDPRALFDWKNHRFIVMAIKCSSPYGAAFVAVSTSDSAVGSWYVYALGPSSSPGAIMDYPRLGQDHTVFYPGTSVNPGAIYIAYNLFNPSYVHEEWHILPKNKMYAGAGFSYWQFNGMTSGGAATDSSQPANVWSPYEKPRAEFFLTSKNNGTSSTALTVWSLSNPFGFNVGGNGPQLTGIVISATNAWTIPPNAPQSGGPNTIDTLDNRFTGSVTYAHGFLHAAHSTANGAGGTATLLYKIQPFLNTGNAACTTAPTTPPACAQITSALIRNESVLNYGSTSAAFMAVAQPDLEGNVAMVLNYSTVAEFPGIVYITQRVTAAPGTWSDSGIYLVGGIGRYTSGRWGDYMAVAPVGVAYQAGNGGVTGNNAMAFSGMYSDSTANNRWRTRVGAVVYSSVLQNSPDQLSVLGNGPLQMKLK